MIHASTCSPPNILPNWGIVLLGIRCVIPSLFDTLYDGKGNNDNKQHQQKLVRMILKTIIISHITTTTTIIRHIQNMM